MPPDETKPVPEPGVDPEFDKIVDLAWAAIVKDQSTDPRLAAITEPETRERLWSALQRYGGKQWRDR